MTPVSLPLKIEQNACSHGDAIAIQCGNRVRTWSELERRSYYLAMSLAAMGCCPKKRVAVMADTSIEYVEVLLAILRCGASAVPLPIMARPETLAQMILDSGSSVVFASKRLHPVAEQALADSDLIDSRCCVGIDFSRRNWIALSSLVATKNQNISLPEILPEQEFNLIYSSGTTGTPKGIIHSHQLRSAQMVAAESLGMTTNAVTLLSTPLYANWTLFGLYSALYGGGKTVLLPRFDTRAWLKLSRGERVSHAFLVPVQLIRLLAEPGFDQFVEGYETMKLCAGSPLPISAKRDTLRRWPGGLVENYGLTEGAPTTLLFADLHPDKLDSVGQVVPGGEIRIIDDDDNELPLGEIGEVVGRSSAMMDGYHHRADLTSDLEWFDANGQRFFCSGDLGRLDQEGFLYLAGRKKDVIISGGMNIYASDIEEVLLTHPVVSEVAVIGVPSEQWGETPLALVVIRNGMDLSQAALQDWANARLGKTQRLSAVEFRQNLPHGTLDKVLKKELRQPYWHTEDKP